MNPERWRRIEGLYQAAWERDAAERAAFLDEACAGDEELRSEVESLLAADEQAKESGGFLNQTALQVAAQALAGDRARSLVGLEIGRYQILSLLGVGGMGEVYLAQDTRLGRKLALKFLPQEFTRDRRRVQRFKHEARAASALNHPNIITIFEIDQINDVHFIAEEFIDGQTLRRRLKGGAAPLSEALDVSVQVVGALAEAHAAGIAHRDIKPENIMLRRDDYVKVLDFGLAKLIESLSTGQPSSNSEDPSSLDFHSDPGMMMGTPHYMSPEQIRGMQIDARADIFSPGVVLYEMVAGRTPFDGVTAGEVVAAILNHEPPPLSPNWRAATVSATGTAPDHGFYVTGGTMRRDAPSSVERQADRTLYEGLLQGKFCYALTSRQMGKSSLMVRTVARLREEGVGVAVLDLTAVGHNLTAEQWYDGLLVSIGRQLQIEDQIEEFWLNHPRLGPLQRWMSAITEVVLPRYPGRLVIFVDEIDVVRSLAFSTDEFFAGIREFYNRRTEEPELERLIFCLLGVATPSDLIRGTRMTPFNIGQRIELNDFTEAEAAPLAQGLQKTPEVGAILLERVFYWTGGHPYLTQRLCQEVAEEAREDTPAEVDRLCQELFLSHKAQWRDDNLLFVRERMLRSEVDLAGLLSLYAQVRRGKRVRDDVTDPLIGILRLSGVARARGGYLVVRNRIYERVFDREWVKTNMPDAELRRQRAAYRRGLLRATAVGSIILILLSGLLIYAFRQRDRADQYAREQELTLARLQTALAEAKRQEEVAIEQRSLAEEQNQIAAKQRTEAEKQRQVAELQRAEAQTQRDRAVWQEQANRRLLYAAHMNLAQQAWESADVGRVEELLALSRPNPGGEDLRGFEWYYLWRLSHRFLSILRHNGGVESVAFSPDGKRLAIGGNDGRVMLWDAVTE